MGRPLDTTHERGGAAGGASGSQRGGGRRCKGGRSETGGRAWRGHQVAGKEEEREGRQDQEALRGPAWQPGPQRPRTYFRRSRSSRRDVIASPTRPMIAR